MGLGAPAGPRAGDIGMTVLLRFNRAGPGARRPGRSVPPKADRPQPGERQGLADAGQHPEGSGSAPDGARYPHPRRPVSRNVRRGESGPGARLPQPQAGLGSPGSRIAGPLRPDRPGLRSQLLPGPVTQPNSGTSMLGVVYP